MLRAREWILLDYVHGSFYKNSIKLHLKPIRPVLRSVLDKWVLTGSADLTVKLCAAFVGRAGRINPDGRIIGEA